MEAFFLELREMKDSIEKMTNDLATYKDENKELKDRIDGMDKEMVQLKTKYNALQKQSNTPKDRTEASACSSTIASDDKKGKKSCKKCTEIERTVEDFKTEFGKGMTRMQSSFDKCEKFQKLLNILHISLQTKKEQQEEAQNLNATGGVPQPVSEAKKMTPPLTKKHSVPSPLVKHPSQASSREEILKLRDVALKCTFNMTSDDIPLLYDNTMWIGEYNGIQCEYFDALSGVFTAPIRGTYEFYVGSKTNNSNMLLFLCVNREEQRIDVTENRSFKSPTNFKIVRLLLMAQDQVWLETIGRAKNAESFLQGLIFRGEKIA